MRTRLAAFERPRSPFARISFMTATHRKAHGCKGGVASSRALWPLAASRLCHVRRQGRRRLSLDHGSNWACEPQYGSWVVSPYPSTLFAGCSSASPAQGREARGTAAVARLVNTKHASPMAPRNAATCNSVAVVYARVSFAVDRHSSVIDDSSVRLHGPNVAVRRCLCAHCLGASAHQQVSRVRAVGPKSK